MPTKWGVCNARTPTGRALSLPYGANRERAGRKSTLWACTVYSAPLFHGTSTVYRGPIGPVHTQAAESAAGKIVSAASLTLKMNGALMMTSRPLVSG